MVSSLVGIVLFWTLGIVCRLVGDIIQIGWKQHGMQMVTE